MNGSSATPPGTWYRERPYRNRNPLDLRPRSKAPPWPAQSGLDTATGGPFAMFETETDGWAAGGLWLFLAHDQWGMTTVRKMLLTFAPWTENDTGAYVGAVCSRLGITEDTPVDVHDIAVRRELSLAMAHVEDFRIPWASASMEEGLLLTDKLWPAFLASYLDGTPVKIPEVVKPIKTVAMDAVAPTRTTTTTKPAQSAPLAADATDALNQRELDGGIFPILEDRT